MYKIGTFTLYSVYFLTCAYICISAIVANKRVYNAKL